MKSIYMAQISSTSSVLAYALLRGYQTAQAAKVYTVDAVMPISGVFKNLRVGSNSTDIGTSTMEITLRKNNLPTPLGVKIAPADFNGATLDSQSYRHFKNDTAEVPVNAGDYVCWGIKGDGTSQRIHTAVVFEAASQIFNNTLWTTGGGRRYHRLGVESSGGVNGWDKTDGFMMPVGGTFSSMRLAAFGDLTGNDNFTLYVNNSPTPIVITITAAAYNALTADSNGLRQFTSDGVVNVSPGDIINVVSDCPAGSMNVLLGLAFTPT